MRGLTLTATSLLVFLSHSCHILAQPPPPWVLPPSQDPFYSPQQLSPVPVPNCSAAYHIVYRTTDARFRPSWALTTLLLPPSYNPSSVSPRPLLSYQLAYNSPDIDASPSYDFSALTVPGGAVAVALGRGWIVSAPDFEGPTASFGAGIQAGHATIDNVRAVLSLSSSKPGNGSKPKLGQITKYATYGYSGGCVATEFAAELTVQYAPEMSFAGAVCGGLVPQIDGDAFEAINKSPFAGDIPAFLVGSLNQFPEAYDYLISSLKEFGPFNKTRFLAVKKMTVLQAFAYFADQDIYQYLIPGREFMNEPIIRKTSLRNSVMGYHGVPPMPMMMYQAIGDKFSNITSTDKLVKRYCTGGAVIENQKNVVGGHMAEITNCTPRALEWLVKVLEGPGVDFLTGECETKIVEVRIVDIPDF
ncbi:lipase [Rhypophila sp. PSN 637]